METKKEKFIRLAVKNSRGKINEKQAEEMFKKTDPLLVDSLIKLYGKIVQH